MIRKVKLAMPLRDMAVISDILGRLSLEAERSTLTEGPAPESPETRLPVEGSSMRLKEKRFRAQMLFLLFDKFHSKLQSAALSGKDARDEVKIKLSYPLGYWLMKTALETQAPWPDDLIWKLDPQL